MRQLLLERLETRTVLEGALKELDGDEHGLRLLPAGEHDGPAEETHLGDDLGHVRAGVGDSHLTGSGVCHATRIHSRPVVMTVASVALYNSSSTEGQSLDLEKPP